YNAYIVATGAECLTEYYTQIGDGNATVTFDLQWRSESGYFGVVAGDSKKLGKLSEMTDYMLFGDGVVSSKTLDNKTDIFEAGYTYRVKFDAKNGAWTVDKKGICESADSFANVLTVANSFTSSNTVGLACYTKDEKSATAVIDNLVITNNSGKYEYVRNIFSGLSSIKDGSMKTLATNALSGEKSTLGKTYIQKSWLCNVRFIAENGEILSSQKVSGYGTATAPVAPAKEGYTFKCWNKSTTGIITDSVFYPIYEAKTIEPDESSSVPDSTKESTDFSSSVSSVDSGKTSSGGCGGGVASVSVLSVAAVAASIAIWRKHRK
ncbi:MAG: InlB B-repeat-containing protein, partial [Christensenellaceae bacterium]